MNTIEPPADYRGRRVGDLIQHGERTYVVAALIPNFEHSCARGWSCKASWKPLCRPVHCDVAK